MSAAIIAPAARLRVVRVGPHVSVQDAGRRGLMRFGVPASGPMMCTPSTRSVAASASTFTLPVVSLIVRARPLARNVNTPFLKAVPAATSCSSVLPTAAISG